MQMFPDKPLKKKRSLLKYMQVFSLTFAILAAAFSCSTFNGIFSPADEPLNDKPEYPASETPEVSDTEKIEIDNQSISEAMSSDIDNLVDYAIPPYIEKTPEKYVEPRLILHEHDIKKKESEPLPAEVLQVSAETSDADADIGIESVQFEQSQSVMPEVSNTAQSTAPSVSASAHTSDTVLQRNSQETAAAALPSETAVQKTFPAETDPQPIILQVSAVAGELSVFELPGEGWLFNGFAESGKDEDAVRYNGRDFLNDNTVFSFFCYRECIAELSFSLTDYRADSIKRAQVLLNAVRSEKADSSVASAESSETEAAEKNGNSSNNQAPELSIQAEAPQVIPENTEDLLEYCKAKAADGNPEEAVELIESKMPDFDLLELDSVYYFLAQQYESVSGLRDIKKSISYYKKIVDEFPISLYWEDSRERINYLERRYIYIR